MRITAVRELWATGGDSKEISLWSFLSLSCQISCNDLVRGNACNVIRSLVWRQRDFPSTALILTFYSSPFGLTEIVKVMKRKKERDTTIEIMEILFLCLLQSLAASTTSLWARHLPSRNHHNGNKMRRAERNNIRPRQQARVCVGVELLRLSTEWKFPFKLFRFFLCCNNHRLRWENADTESFGRDKQISELTTNFSRSDVPGNVCFEFQEVCEGMRLAKRLFLCTTKFAYSRSATCRYERWMRTICKLPTQSNRDESQIARWSEEEILASNENIKV